MSKLEIVQIPVLSDNYTYLVHDALSGETIVIDSPLSKPVLDCLQSKDWSLDAIWNTHHHPDHTGGNLELKRASGCTIIGPQTEKNRIPGLEKTVSEGDTVYLGQHKFQVLFLPGHTKGHIAYWSEEDGILFCGDVLFLMGCGRIFEGTAAQMWDSLKKIRALPDSTKIYCAHEYSMDNARFALWLEEDNPQLSARAEEIRNLREKGKPTIPFTLSQDKQTNPFLRADERQLQKSLNMEGEDPLEVFTYIRLKKDQFR